MNLRTFFDAGLFAGLFAAALILVMFSVPAKSATEQEFHVTSTTDYVALCSGMNDTQQRTLAGAAGRYIYDQHKKAEQRSYQQGYAAGKSSKSN